jgi:hypothetical protein
MPSTLVKTKWSSGQLQFTDNSATVLETFTTIGFKQSGNYLRPVVTLTATSLGIGTTLSEATHAGKTVLVTSGTADAVLYGTVTLPSSSGGTAGAVYTIVSGFTGTPTSNGIWLKVSGTNAINGLTSGLGLKGSTLGKAGSSLTLVNGDAAGNFYTIAKCIPQNIAATSLIWATTA